MAEEPVWRTVLPQDTSVIPNHHFPVQKSQDIGLDPKISSCSDMLRI